MEDNSSQLELVLSTDMDEQIEGNAVRESVNPPVRLSSINIQGLHSYKNACFVAVAALSIFAFGSLIGYVAHTNSDKASQSCTDSSEDMFSRETIVDWNNLTAALKSKLTTSSIDSSLSGFSSDSHQAGSPGDEVLVEKVFKKFQDYNMNPWTDLHPVKIQDRPTSGTNRVTFRNKTYHESGYLVYSAVGSAQGAVLYANYGQASDFRQLKELNITLSGRVVLVRAGEISFAEKVANAASVNASAVLIYPDPKDYPVPEDTDLFGHVHLGSGDPYTPGFPSFNHTQFPPARSSGLPNIPAQTIRASTAAAIMREMGGRDAPRGWGDGGLQNVMYKLGADDDNISVEVNNVVSEIMIHNVFGVVKGFIDPDRYLVIGAQRDAWGPGYATATVGTSLLVELARAITEMISRDGFKPRRSIVFASWSGGEYGSVGATEWLEGYLPSLNMKAFSYISLDGVVTGSSFKASASPLMSDLIQSTLKEVSSPSDSSKTLSELLGSNWETVVMEPMRLSDSVYPFQTFSGIPSVSIRFTQNKSYPFFGTMLDTRRNLEGYAPDLLGLAKAAAEVAGQMALRLVHDHLLRLNTQKYVNIMRVNVARISKEVGSLQRAGLLPEPLKTQWFSSALGSYSRAVNRLLNDIKNSDLEDKQQCRILNDRIMGVERNLLSPYLSPRESPFRHILLGSGSHTLRALLTHLSAIKEGSVSADIDLLKNQFALATWTIQGCATALAGNIWDLDNQID